MFRCCAARLISQKWAPCSAQVQSLVADSQQDASGKTLQSARNFLRDVDTTRVICAMDDALELVYFMQRVQYPKASKLETAAREWLDAHANEFEQKHLRLVCRYIVESAQRGANVASAVGPSTAQWAAVRKAPHVAAVGVWKHVVLRTAWFRNRFVEMVRTMDLDDALLVAKVLMWSREAPSASLGVGSNIAEDSAPHTQPSVAVDDTGIVSQTVQQRCKEILMATLQPQTKNSRNNGMWLLRTGAVPLRRDELVALLTHVLSHDTTGELVALIQPHLRALSAEDTAHLVGTMSGHQQHAHQLQVIQYVVSECFLAAADRDGCDDCTTLRLGTQLCMSVLATTQESASEAPSGEVRTAVRQLCSQLTERWSRHGRTADEEGAKRLADVLSVLEQQGGAPLPESDALLRATSTATTPTLYLLLCATLNRSAEWKAVWYAFAERHGADGDAALPQKLKRDPGGQGPPSGISLEGSKDIVRALSILLLREDGVATPAGTNGMELLSAEHLHRTHAIVAACTKRMLDDAVSLSIREIAALLYVTVLVADAEQQRNTAGGVAASAQPELTDRLVQRLVHSSKFVSASFGGGIASNSRGSSASLPSGNIDGGAAAPGWSLSVARMVVLALAVAEYSTPRHPALVDILNQVFDDAVSRWSGQRTSAVPLGLGQCASLLVALSDAQLHGAMAMRSVLQLVLIATPTASSAALVRALTVMSVLNLRDMHIACTLLRQMERCQEVTPLLIVQAGDAARRLRLTQQFQNCKLSQRVTSLSLGHVASTPAPLRAIADPMQLELFAILLSVSVVDEQRRLFALAQKTTVAGTTQAAGGGAATLLAQYSNGLEAYLSQHHAVALMLLACKECPAPIMSGVASFLSTAAPLSADEADPIALVAAVAAMDDTLLDRKHAAGAVGDAQGGKGLRDAKGRTACLPGASVVDATLFAHLMAFGVHSVLKLDEPSLAQLIGTTMALDSVPNSVFRVIGRRIGALADGMTPENAIKCLELYAKYKVRDDRVVKSLLHRCVFTMGMIGGSVDLSTRLRRVIEAYPHWSSTASQALQRYGAIKARRERRTV